MPHNLRIPVFLLGIEPGLRNGPTLRIFQPVRLAPQGFIRLLIQQWLFVLMVGLRAGFACPPNPSNSPLSNVMQDAA